MSYRLIDANAIASQRPEVNYMPCIYADLDKGLDGHHYDLRGANTLQAENAKLREQLERVQPTDCEGNVLDIGNTVHMLRSEYDGDHEWEDVVTELVLTKWGGDRWIVRGSKGEAWACDCAKTGYDEDAYEASDDVEPFDEPTLLEVENAKLRELVAQRTAKRVVVSNAGTDHATGHCACGACGGAIDPWDAYCRHCGAKLEEDA